MLEEIACCTQYAGYEIECGVGTTPCRMKFDNVPGASNPEVHVPTLASSGWATNSWTETEMPRCVGLQPFCLDGMCVWPFPPTNWWCGDFSMDGPPDCGGGGVED